MTGRPETNTPAGRLRLLSWLAADREASQVGADTLPWICDRLREDLPLLLELHSACEREDDRRVLELLDRLEPGCVCADGEVPCALHPGEVTG